MEIFFRIIWYVAFLVWGVALYEWWKVQRLKDKGYKELEKISFWTILLLCSSLVMILVTIFLK